MLKNILNTIGTRLFVAGISFSMLLLNTNLLGAEGVGTIGLLILGISIFLLICHFVNGGGLIYFAPRHSIWSLMLLSYAWTILIGFIFYLSITFLPTFLGSYAYDLLLLGILLSLASTNTNLLLGKESVKAFNLCYLIQSLVQITALLIFYFIFQDQSVSSFIKATYLGYGSNFISSMLILSSHIKVSQSPSKKLFFSLLKYGFYLQLANLFQLFNYRLSYYLLQLFSGRAAVGIYTSGVQLSEGMLLPSKSLGTVQYARISNLKSDVKAAKLSLSMMKVAFGLTFPIIGIVLLIPSSFFVSVLGNDFQQTKPVIAIMALGILALSMEGVLGRFFSGTGKQRINTANTAIGLGFTLIFGFWLIPIYGLYGAAITSTLAYLSMFFFISYQLKLKAKLKYRDFMLRKEDWQLVKQSLRKGFKPQVKSEKD